MAAETSPGEYALLALNACEHAVRLLDTSTGEVLFQNHMAREFFERERSGRCFPAGPTGPQEAEDRVVLHEGLGRWFRCTVRDIDVPGKGVVRCQEAVECPKGNMRFALHNVSARLLTATRTALDDAIRDCLAELGRAAASDNVCLFALSRDGGSVKVAQEWCADGAAPLSSRFGDLSAGRAPWWVGEVRGGRDIHFRCVGDAPTGAAAERAIMDDLGIKSLLYIPMRSSEGVVGFLGFHMLNEARAWMPEEIETLRTAAGMLTGAIERGRHADALEGVLNGLRREEERYRTLFEHSPVALWEWDLTPVKIWIDEMRSMGMVSVEDYLGSRHGDMRRLLSRISVKQVNRAALDLHELQEWSPVDGVSRVIPDDGLPAVAGAFAHLVSGARTYEVACPALTMSGRCLKVIMHLAAAPGHEDSLSRVFVSEVDVTELQEAQQRARDSRAQLRALAARVDAVREEERARLARRIHDDIGHAITALKIELGRMTRKLEATVPAEAGAEIRERIATMGGLLSDTIRAAQETAAELRPGTLDDLGISAALEWEAETFRTRTGIRCDFSCNCPGLDIKRAPATAIYRICQELLTNVARHAQATHVVIRLMETGDEIMLEVQDNGIGITREEIARPRSLGLLGIRERTTMLGGEFDIQGRPGEGTRAVVRMPVYRTEYSFLE